jgi:8-oxo-dGTP diphosphatase
MYDYKHWVVGLLFRNRSEVVLVLKTHPEFQRGKLNGVGGKIEGEETTRAAMRREFREEAGADIPESAWREFALLKEEAGDVTFLVAHGDYDVRTMTDEAVAWYRVVDLRSEPVMPDLHWLIPLALDDQNRYTTIDYQEPR